MVGNSKEKKTKNGKMNIAGGRVSPKKKGRGRPAEDRGTREKA